MSAAESAKVIADSLAAQKCQKGSSRTYVQTSEEEGADGETTTKSRVVEEHQHVKLFAGDVVACCKAAKEKTKIVKALQKGSAELDPMTLVVIQADDAFHLLEQLG